MYAVNRLAPEPKRISRLVIGPDGFTESFDERTVETLVKTGLIELSEQDDPNNDENYQVKVYRATGRKSYA